MPVTRTLVCPDCSKTFSWLFMARDESDAPDFCPRCGNLQSEQLQSLPSTFSIGTAKGKAADATYRQIEAASEVRAAAAGDPAMKITNMKDNLREGDVAAMAPQPSREYQDQVAAAGAMAGGFDHWQGNPMGAATSDLVALAKSGQTQGTGAGMLRAIQANRGAPAAPSGVAGIKAGFGGMG